MKIIRKFVWLLLTLGLLVLTVQTASPIALGLAICMVVLPLMCLPLNLLAAKKLKLSTKMPVNLRKHQNGIIELTVQNPSLVPICLCACRIRLENQLNGEVQSMTLSCGVWPKKKQTVKATFGSPFCGRIRMTVASVRLYDCFGLLGVKAKTDAHTASVVQPDTFPQSLILTPSSARVEEAEDYSTERPGSDLSEIFQIRDYVPGDSPRQVHWKLSQKYGKLIVKDASLPITRSAALFWERTEEAPTNARTDAEAEIVVSLCRNLLAQSVQFTLCWNENGQLVRHLVRDLDELIALLPRLLTASPETGLSGAQLLLQTTPAGAYSHLIYVSGELPADPNLQILGHLTVLVCGADYTEINYPEQLSELTI